MRNRLLLLILSSVALAGCASRNLHRNYEEQNPPLKHGFVYMTRDFLLDAGKEPVEFGGPAATKDTVFVASQTRGVEALERSLFRRKWQFIPKGGVESQLLVDGDSLYFGANDGVFYALDSNFGKVRWKYTVKAPVYSRAAIAGDKVYVTAADDTVYCLDRQTGKWVWHYRRGNDAFTTIHGNATPLVDGGHVYVGFSDGYFVSLNAQDGNLEWEQKLHKGTKFTDVDAMAVLDEGRLYVPSYDGDLYALEKAGGKVVWHVEVGGSRKVILDGKTLYLGSSNGNVYSINKDTGRTQWKFELDQGTPTSLIQYEKFIAFGSSQQYFYAIHKGDGSLAYRYNAGLRSGFVSSPTQIDRDIFVLSNFGNLHVFSWDLSGAKTKL